MKKSLFFYAAAAALMLTACSSEDDILQTGQTKKVAPQEVGFDVYTPAATNVTRAGLVGTMTTNRLQRSDGDGGGFGVYAFLTEDADADGDDVLYSRGNGSEANVPNFMANEEILWNSTNLGWYYNPLKYWPNETDNDSQTTPATMNGTDDHTDRLTFFAYAPYVAADNASGTGIIRITDKTGTLNLATPSTPTDPTIEWKATTAVETFNPNEGVDLLWGVAPSGGLSYTAVNGQTVTRNEGTPLLNMIKPDVNTSMKFLFQHALARFGINVVAAIDQVAPGGKLDPNTKITINSLKITGAFGTTGELNLNNDGHPSVANWTKINNTSITSSTADLDNTTSITVTANNATPTNNYIAENLRWKAHATYPHTTPVAQTVVGVTTAKQDLLAPSTKWFNKLAAAPAYNPGKKYYTDEGSTEATAQYTATAADATKYYKPTSGHYTLVSSGNKVNAPEFPGENTVLVTLEETWHGNPSEAPSPAKEGGYYEYDGSKYTFVESPTWDGTNTYYAVKPVPVSVYTLGVDKFTYTGTNFYEAERNYLYVVPTNAALKDNFGNVTTNAEKLRTITVEIEYYISTEDSKLNAERAETKNVIKKDVILPSLANGKTYMLNLILGLTSVKIEAEVDDWKVINVNGNLPQNTAE